MEEIKLNFMREDPKHGAKEYKISTIQDMGDAVTEDNIDGFLEDLKVTLMGCIFLNHLHKEIGSTERVIIKEMVWIDDKK